jgi:hypothetical protein
MFHVGVDGKQFGRWPHDLFLLRAQDGMERKYRATAAAGLAVLLLALVALVVNVSDGVDTVDLLQILKSQDGSVSEGSSKSWDKELKVLKKTYGTEQSLAGKMTSKVDKAMSADKKKLIAAKSLLKDGMEDELTAKMDVDHAGKLRTLAQKLKDESQAARRKFVAQERPVLLAQKLAVHDHKNYRSDELAVAKEVALLSEHPSDKDLRKKVDKLVHRSKDAKKRMGEDGLLLKKLEKKTADAQLGGTYERGFRSDDVEGVIFGSCIALSCVLYDLGESESLHSKGFALSLVYSMSAALEYLHSSTGPQGCVLVPLH